MNSIANGPNAKPLSATRIAHLSAISMLVCFCACSCSGSDESSKKGSTCNVPVACGGNLDGAWQVDSVCIEGDMVAALNANSGLSIACRSLYQSVSSTLSGTLTYSNSTESRNVTTTMITEVLYTPACMTAEGREPSVSGCGDIESQAVANDRYASVSCTYSSSGCQCTLTSQSTDTAAVPYTISGSKIVYSNGDAPSSYCISGTKLTTFGPGQGGYQNLIFVGTAHRM